MVWDWGGMEVRIWWCGRGDRWACWVGNYWVRVEEEILGMLM
jgi:hypothetical protein